MVFDCGTPWRPFIWYLISATEAVYYLYEGLDGGSGFL